jgi:hypothetical protein
MRAKEVRIQSNDFNDDLALHHFLKRMIKKLVPVICDVETNEPYEYQ